MDLEEAIAKWEKLFDDRGYITLPISELKPVIEAAERCHQSETALKAAGEWKHTVRDIYDELHFGTANFANSECARQVIRMIEARHKEYFCEENKS